MIALIFAVSGILVGIVLFLHFWKGIPFGDLTRDPVAIFQSRMYVGFLSQVGIFFWAACAAVCVFSAMVLSRHPASLEIRPFLYVSGLLTLFLGLDDAFLLHEEFFPDHVHVPEKAVYVTYVVLVVIYLARFRSIIFKTEYRLLGMALGFLAISVLLDWFPEPLGVDSSFFEDSAKLVGIVSWLVYFVRAALGALRSNLPINAGSAGANTSVRENGASVASESIAAGRRRTQ